MSPKISNNLFSKLNSCIRKDSAPLHSSTRSIPSRPSPTGTSLRFSTSIVNSSKTVSNISHKSVLNKKHPQNPSHNKNNSKKPQIKKLIITEKVANKSNLRGANDTEHGGLFDSLAISLNSIKAFSKNLFQQENGGDNKKKIFAKNIR